jgi:hypothetical protein
LPSPSSSPAAALTRAGLVRVAVYYLVFGVVAVLLVRFVPIVAEALGGGTAGGALDAGGVFGPGTQAPVGNLVFVSSPWRQAGVASIAMLAALALMMPVTWVYMLTRSTRGFDESVVHTLLILPVAVTGIVMVVKSSVALAFSLAGIVAAVRFRTTLDDTKDAVYVFLAIGVGLASGIQSVGVAVALSLVFNVLVLLLWGTRFGDVELVRGGPSVGTTNADDPSGRLGLLISEERAKKKEKRANALLLVHARVAEGAQAHVDRVLEEKAVRWRLAEVGPGPSGVRLVYMARLEGEGTQGAIMDRLGAGAGGAVERAELRSLKGIEPSE